MKRTDKHYPKPMPNPACAYRYDGKYPYMVRLSFTDGRTKAYWPELALPTPHLDYGDDLSPSAALEVGYQYSPPGAAKRCWSFLRRFLRTRDASLDITLDRMKTIIMEREEEILAMRQEQETLKEQLHDCVNELCSHCGRYKHEHEGACDACRWLRVKEGEQK